MLLNERLLYRALAAGKKTGIINFMFQTKGFGHEELKKVSK